MFTAKLKLLSYTHTNSAYLNTAREWAGPIVCRSESGRAGGDLSSKHHA